jgi:iron complex transport system permease protein
MSLLINKSSHSLIAKLAWSVTVFLALLLVVITALSIGSASVGLEQVIGMLECHLFSIDECQVSSIQQKIIWEIRFPRTVLAMLAGAGLAIAGVVLQTITRNPLADPYLFGISSGAAFGAVLSFYFFPNNTLLLNISAFSGGLLSVIMVLLLASGSAGRQVEKLILSGVAISFLLGAATSLTLYFSEPDASATIIFWMMGSFTKADWATLWLPTIVVILSGIFVYFISHWLNALLIGDETAHTLGLRVGQFRLIMLVVTSLTTAVIVAQCGGVGFIGLMVPHLVRKLVGGEIKKVILATIIIGPIFMVIVDVVSRILIQHQEVPIGIITAIVGSIFFFLIMRKH